MHVIGSSLLPPDMCHLQLSFVIPLMIFGGVEALVAVLLLLPVSCCACLAIPCLCAASLRFL